MKQPPQLSPPGRLAVIVEREGAPHLRRLYDAAGYEARAEECVRLANLTEDVMLREQILSLRQNYLGVAERLRTREEAANSLLVSGPGIGRAEAYWAALNVAHASCLSKRIIT